MPAPITQKSSIVSLRKSTFIQQSTLALATAGNTEQKPLMRPTECERHCHYTDFRIPVLTISRTFHAINACYFAQKVIFFSFLFASSARETSDAQTIIIFPYFFFFVQNFRSVTFSAIKRIAATSLEANCKEDEAHQKKKHLLFGIPSSPIHFPLSENGTNRRSILKYPGVHLIHKFNPLHGV